MNPAERLADRLGRVRLGSVPPGTRTWVVLTWLATLGLALVILIPGLTDALTAEGDGVIATFSAPLWFRVAVLLAAAVLAGAATLRSVMAGRMLEQPSRAASVARALTVVAVPLLPALALAADRAFALAAIALLLGVLVAVAAPRAAAAVSAVLAALPWLVPIVHQFDPVGASAGSWLWVSLFGVAAALAAFGSYYGVARAAESRTAKLRFLTRLDLHPLAVLGIVLAGVAIVALRLTVLRELFPLPDPLLWRPFDATPSSWLVGSVVAALLVVVGVRSSWRPLRRFGERGVVAGLAALGNLELIISVLLIALGMIVAVVTGAVLLPDSWKPFVPVAKFAGVVALGAVMLLPVFRGTAARWVGIITAVFLAATTAGNAFGSDALRALAPSPVQVLLPVLVAALALAVWNLVRPARAVSPSIVARLAAVPLIAVHAGWLLPAAWSGLGRVVVVLAVLLALFWLMPPVAADATRHALDVVSASAAQLLTLLTFVLAIPSLFADGALTVLGLLWLAIPVMAALTIDTQAAGENQ